jgi:hypothetical protein
VPASLETSLAPKSRASYGPADVPSSRDIFLISLPRNPLLPLKQVAALALIATTVVLSSCGGGGDGDPIVATVGAHSKVSRATLVHWMNIALGGDYRPLFREASPAGLVSDPPDYSRCTRVSATIPHVPGKPKLTPDQRRVKCRQLYAAVSEQALNLVLSGLRAREEARELGIRMPSEQEVSRRVQEYVAHDFKSPETFREAIAHQHRSLSDVRYMTENTLLQASITNRLSGQAARLGGGGEAAAFRLILQNSAKWKARTSCSPGYRSSSCRQYQSGSEVKPPASLVLEYFRKGIG